MLFRTAYLKHLLQFYTRHIRSIFDSSLNYKNGTSVAQCYGARLSPSEVAGSILSDNVINVTRTQCPTHVKRVSRLRFLSQSQIGK